MRFTAFLLILIGAATALRLGQTDVEGVQSVNDPDDTGLNDEDYGMEFDAMDLDGDGRINRTELRMNLIKDRAFSKKHWRHILNSYNSKRSTDG